MSFATRTSPLETISEVKLEGVVGDDELYYMVAEVWNQTTEEFEPYDLTLAAKIEFSIKVKTTGSLIYTTDDDPGGTTAAPYYKDEITRTDEANGKFNVEIPAIASIVVPVAIHKYDVQVTTVAGSKKKTVLRGDIQFVEDITP